MIAEWLPSFMDEMEKVAVELDPQQQRRQAAQFTALGAGTGIAAGVAKNVIEHGKVFAPGTASKGRWALAHGATGALMAGAVPAVRHHIERQNVQQAIQKRRAQRAVR